MGAGFRGTASSRKLHTEHWTLDTEYRNKLLAAARQAMAAAYCPYSGFAVGAAVLAKDGRVFAAANVENASYGLTVCAERNALLQAVNAGARPFRALAVAAGGRKPVTPCGACRQVLAEFCASEMPVFCGTHSGAVVVRTTVGRLLPRAFRLPRAAANRKGVSDGSRRHPRTAR